MKNGLDSIWPRRNGSTLSNTLTTLFTIFGHVTLPFGLATFFPSLHVALLSLFQTYASARPKKVCCPLLSVKTELNSKTKGFCLLTIKVSQHLGFLLTSSNPNHQKSKKSMFRCLSKGSASAVSASLSNYCFSRLKGKLRERTINLDWLSWRNALHRSWKVSK